jgi:hypothetical protein
MGTDPFWFCFRLTAITVDPTNPSYSSLDGVLFNSSTTTLIQCPEGKAGSYTIPGTVTSVGDDAFAWCWLNSVTIPISVTSIGDGAFCWCSSLTSAVFMGNAPAMGDGVFNGAPNSFTAYYFNGATGFTSPTWDGYKTVSVPTLFPEYMLTVQDSSGASLSRTISFVSTQVGSTRDVILTITNTSGYTISGSASISAPFSIVSGGTYTLSAGQSKSVTIGFTPTVAVPYNVPLIFTTIFGNVMRQVTGTGYADPVAASGSIAGQITQHGTSTPIAGVTVSANGSLATSNVNGNYTLPGLNPGMLYTVIVTPKDQQFSPAEFNNVVVTAGKTTSLNIQLTPLPSSQPPSPQDIPVVLVRGLGHDQDWFAGEDDYWSDLTFVLQFDGLIVWDCNNPEDGTLLNSNGQPGHFINGEKSIQDNAVNLYLYIQQKAVQFKAANGYYPPKINIVTHSMGGLIVRCALKGSDHFNFSDPFTFGDPSAGVKFKVNVNMVVMLAPPNAGSEVADYVALKTSALQGWDWSLLNFPVCEPFWASTLDLTTQHIRYNFDPSWSSNVPLYLYAGTGGSVSSNSLIREGADIIKKKNSSLPMDAQMNDGAVALTSVSGSYYLYGINTLMSCFTATPLEEAIDTDAEFGSNHLVDHFSVLNDTATLDWVMSKLDPQKAEIQSGALPEN